MICSLLHQESLEELVSQSEYMYYLLLNALLMYQFCSLIHSCTSEWSRAVSRSVENWNCCTKALAK